MIAIKHLKELYRINEGITAEQLVDLAEKYVILTNEANKFRYVGEVVHVGDIKMKNTLCPAYSNGNCVSPHTKNTICEYDKCKLFDNK